MNEKEISELRRRFKPERSSITRICGCYVNDKGEILSEFEQPLSMMTQEENEMLLSTLRRTLSGTIGKNLINLEFETKQVVSGEEHKLLMRLRDSKLKDKEAVQALYQKAAKTISMECSCLLLLICDAYDVPYRTRDGEEQQDASEEIYSYILCSICPIKQTKPALRYYAHENAFRGLPPDTVVGAPELGFLFPAFDDRSTNLYGALYYNHNPAENYEAFADAVLHALVPLPATAQKETFQAILHDALGDECRYEVVQTVQNHLCEMIELHKQEKIEEPLTISENAMRQVLTACGVSDAKTTAFAQQYEAEFGADTALSPRNLVDPKRMEVATPEVTIRVSPAASEMVQFREIDGRRYILIDAAEGVEVNGVPVQLSGLQSD